MHATDFDTDEMCDRHADWTTINFVMDDWAQTHSPLIYWYTQLHPFNLNQRHKE